MRICCLLCFLSKHWLESINPIRLNFVLQWRISIRCRIIDKWKSCYDCSRSMWEKLRRRLHPESISQKKSLKLPVSRTNHRNPSVNCRSPSKWLWLSKNAPDEWNNVGRQRSSRFSFEQHSRTDCSFRMATAITVARERHLFDVLKLESTWTTRRIQVFVGG